MNTKYNHKLVEEGKNEKWIEKEYFSKHDDTKEPFAVLLPPPNVTGKLHLGHAWDTMIQDTLIRFKKLKGYDTFWIAGMDHAGIATQAKVEQKLRENNLPDRYELGRDKFLDKLWEWKEEYASVIRKQWGKLGLALDYKREKFTMDSDIKDAVQEVFINLYNRNLIYKGVRPINWDPKLQTVLSNIEVENKETEQKMYYIDYQLVNGGIITIATVRTETLYSDVAIAINPKDELMKKYIGQEAIHPLTGLKLPIIADENIEIGKGTGAMKVSAHAEPDFTILKSNNLPINESIDKEGKMLPIANEFSGLDRFKARELIAKKLINENKISKIEDTISAVGYSERSGAPVEVLIQSQWFVDMKPMAKKILENLNSKNKVSFFPKRFANNLVTWMENIQDWCISRQLWWGHRIPAWYKDDQVKVQVESPGEGWKQDEDVLDTWFSSGIAPFSFLGWPNNENMLKRYYPTSLLVTGYDIIFFWVARMYFQGLDFMDNIPFKEVLIHGLIRDEQGRKMSKSLGNGIDPMKVIDKYGADSLRWFLLTNSTPGQDIRFSTQKLEAAWNLNNKLWNISRYVLEVMEDNDIKETPADNWILNKLKKLEKLVDHRMGTYEFTIIGKELTSFIMDDFSSWYIEFTKSTPNKKVAKEVLKRLLVILHPMLPNITDHIYNMVDGEEILESTYQKWSVNNNSSYIDDVISIVKAIREFRTLKNLSNKELIQFSSTKKLSQESIIMIKSLANASLIEKGDALIKVNDFKIMILLSEEMKASENKRISDRIELLKKEIQRASMLLENEKFVLKAPPSKINEEKEKLVKFKKELKDLEN